MSKTNFINKKFLTIFLVLIVLVGVGIGLYFIFKPKPNLKEPYNNTYSLYQNSTCADVIEFNQDLLDILTNKDFSTLNEETEQQIEISKYKYQIFSNIFSSYENIKETLLKNLIFLEEKDEFYSSQQKLTESYNMILDKSNTCKNYINDYLNPNVIDTYQTNQLLWQKINNYNNFYDDFAKELVTYYSIVGDIFNKFTIDSINANRYVRYNILTTVKWAENTAKFIIDYDVLISLDDLLDASNKLNNFVDVNIVNPANEYFEDLEFYNYVLDCFNHINFNVCIEALACNNYINFANSLDEDLTNYASILQKNYFMV